MTVRLFTRTIWRHPADLDGVSLGDGVEALDRRAGLSSSERCAPVG